MVSPDSLATACALSGRNSTYRPVQISETTSVIVIWRERSVKSDWVCAEAGRAKADGKLIPVKQQTLRYSDIPLPFGEMHSENLNPNDMALIRAAVVAPLARA